MQGDDPILGLDVLVPMFVPGTLLRNVNFHLHRKHSMIDQQPWLRHKKKILNTILFVLLGSLHLVTSVLVMQKLHQILPTKCKEPKRTNRIIVKTSSLIEHLKCWHLRLGLGLGVF